MRLRPTHLAAAIGLATILGSCRAPAPTDPRMVSEWVHTLYGILRAERVSPPVASRFLGYASLALYEGLAAATPGMPSLAPSLTRPPALPEAPEGIALDPTLVANEAERTVIDSLLGEALAATRATLGSLVDSLRRTRTSAGVSEAVVTRSEELGRRIGNAIVAWSRTDGFDSTRTLTYVPPSGPGLWVNDAPGHVYAAQNLSGATQFVALDNPANTLRSDNASDRGLILNRPKRASVTTLPALDMAGTSEPYWGRIRPFVLKSWDECPLAPPPAFGTTKDAPLYQEALEVYETRMRLTPEQKMTALFWADNPGETATPAGHWVAIGAQMADRLGLSAQESARLFVLSSFATADAFIASWGYKYKHNLIRPRTYIRQVIDPEWEPLVPTPPFPEYPSGHSTQSAASALILKAMVGDQEFEDSTEMAIGHPVRRFVSFDSAAEQAGWSRIYGGIHFHAGKTGGKSLGTCVGQKILERAGAVGVAGR